MFMLNNTFSIQVISLQRFCGWHNSIKYCYILVLGTAPFCLYYCLNPSKHPINQILTHPGINLVPNPLPQLQHPTWTCFITPTLFLRCYQSCSIGLRSGDCPGNGRTLKSLSLNQFLGLFAGMLWTIILLKDDFFSFLAIKLQIYLKIILQMGM